MIRQWQLKKIEFDATVFLDHADAILQQGQRAQAQEIHLEQADLLQIPHDPLRGDDRFFLAGSVIALAHHALQRYIIGKWTIGDDDAGGVGAGVAIGAFELASNVDQFLDGRVAFALLAQIGALLQGLVQRYA